MKIKKSAINLMKKYGVKKAGIFGSYARKENRENSDIDILIDIKKNISLLDIIKMKIELEKILKKRVDLVEYNTIKPLIKKQILKEEIKII